MQNNNILNNINNFKLDSELRKTFNQKSNLRGFISLSRDWGLLISAFGLSLYFPNIFIYILSILLLSATHAGLAILTHECAHRSLFNSPKLNDFIGQYFCALPNFNHMPFYRAYHMQHHRMAGTNDDPDKVMTDKFPIDQTSLRRKLLRDISGKTGVKFFIGVVGMMAGYWKFQQNGMAEKIIYNQKNNFFDYLKIFIKNGGLVSIFWQISLFGILFLLGNGYLYLLWVLAFIFPFPLFMRLRQIADHAMVYDQNSTNPLLHARSTQANFLTKLFIAPHNEHYHLEHHLLPTAPHWQLPKLNQFLMQNNLILQENQATGMMDVLRRVTK